MAYDVADEQDVHRCFRGGECEQVHFAEVAAAHLVAQSELGLLGDGLGELEVLKEVQASLEVLGAQVVLQESDGVGDLEEALGCRAFASVLRGSSCWSGS